MVDQILYKQQNYEKSVLEKPKLRCQIHQNQQVDFIYLNTDSKNLLICNKCAVQNQLNIDELVLMNEIFSNDSQDIIHNWPPFQDKKLYKLLKSKLMPEDKISVYIQQINLQFDQFRLDIQHIIDDHKKKIIAHINMKEDYRQNLSIVYNLISEKEEIKNKISCNQNNSKELEDFLRKIILEKKKCSKKNEQMLKDSLDILQQQFSFDHILNLTKQILQDLKTKDFLNLKKSNEIINNNSVNQEYIFPFPKIEIPQSYQSQNYQNQYQYLNQYPSQIPLPQNRGDGLNGMIRQPQRQEENQIQQRQDLLQLDINSYQNLNKYLDSEKIKISLEQSFLLF